MTKRDINAARERRIASSEKRGRYLSEPIEVPRGVVDLARRRTAFAMDRLMHYDFSLRMALASAYVQVMNDAIDALSSRAAP